MIGLLGFIGWKVTVISSNFIALNVNFKYGNEYSCNSKIFTIEKRISSIKEATSNFKRLVKK